MFIYIETSDQNIYVCRRVQFWTLFSEEIGNEHGTQIFSFMKSLHIHNVITAEYIWTYLEIKTVW